MREEMMGCWDILASAGPYAKNDPIRTSLLTDNHTNTSSLNFYRPGALPDAQPTVSKQWQHQQSKHCTTITTIIVTQSKQTYFLMRVVKKALLPPFTTWYSTALTTTERQPTKHSLKPHHTLTLRSVYSLQPLVQRTVWPQLVVQPVG